MALMVRSNPKLSPLNPKPSPLLASSYTTEQLARLVGIVQSYLTVRWYTLRKVPVP